MKILGNLLLTLIVCVGIPVAAAICVKAPASSIATDATSVVFDCVVTNSAITTITVVCDTRSRHKGCTADSTDFGCLHQTLDISRESWKGFSGKEWPLNPQPGELLKGTWDEQGHFVKVASCEERRRQAIEKKYGEDGRAPSQGMWPGDCGRLESDFIKQLRATLSISDVTGALVLPSPVTMGTTVQLSSPVMTTAFPTALWTTSGIPSATVTWPDMTPLYGLYISVTPDSEPYIRNARHAQVRVVIGDQERRMTLREFKRRLLRRR